MGVEEFGECLVGTDPDLDGDFLSGAIGDENPISIGWGKLGEPSEKSSVGSIEKRACPSIISELGKNLLASKMGSPGHASMIPEKEEQGLEPHA
jgi:hypothetical protein